MFVAVQLFELSDSVLFFCIFVMALAAQYVYTEQIIVSKNVFNSFKF